MKTSADLTKRNTTRFKSACDRYAYDVQNLSVNELIKIKWFYLAMKATQSVSLIKPKNTGGKFELSNLEYVKDTKFKKKSSK